MLQKKVVIQAVCLRTKTGFKPKWRALSIYEKSENSNSQLDLDFLIHVKKTTGEGGQTDIHPPPAEIGLIIIFIGTQFKS